MNNKQKILRYSYPINLILDTLLEETSDNIWASGACLSNLTLSVEFALSHLPQRDREILWLIYRENMPYREIGPQYGISAERVRQIKAMALRKLRKWYPPGCRLFTEGLDAYIEHEKEEAAKKAAAAEKARAVRDILIEEKVGMVAGGAKDAAIDDLGLDTRTYHVLLKAGYQNVSEILRTPLQELKGLPGMGDKTYFGLLDTLAECGYLHNGS